ncbi:MAG: hypothetical protein AAGB29_11660 [Planctomycetota bacterium]
MSDSQERNPWQGYFDWQVTTLMLARDLHDPIRTGDETAAEARRQEMEHYVAQLTRNIVPADLWSSGQAWPPEVLREITTHTIGHAGEIIEQGFDDASRRVMPPLP